MSTNFIVSGLIFLGCLLCLLLICKHDKEEALWTEAEIAGLEAAREKRREWLIEEEAS